MRRVGEERRDDERDVMAYLKEWSPWEATAASADASRPDAPGADPVEPRRVAAPPSPPAIASAPDVPLVDPPPRPVPHPSDLSAPAARYRRRGWQIAGAVFGLLFVALVVVLVRNPMTPVVPEPAAVGTPVAAPAPSPEPTMWLNAGEGWFYEDADRTRMRNRDNACTLGSVDLAAAAGADPILSEAEITESVIGRYAVDPSSVTPQDPAVIVGREFAVTRLDGVAFDGEDAASVVFVVVRAEPGAAPMVVTLACPPAALDGAVPALSDALQNVWIQPRS
ncbi:hypothetical protein HQQ81_03090 [Microbacteriaceae bacterium VKM Ac-2854]|nr:hypothetical protein [Microbacteriaceae bacterium VKM Ac-2854]